MRAADAGNCDAQVTIACYFRDGHGVERDDEKSLHYLEKAAEQGSAVAAEEIGTLCFLHAHTELAIYWWHEAAERGCSFAMRKLGNIYMGALGMTRDFVEAREWFSLAAMAGADAEAIAADLRMVDKAEDDCLKRAADRVRDWV